VNEYRWPELRVGLSATFSVQLTAAHVAHFIEASGDTNPLHTDEEYARKLGHPGRVVHGLLTASLYSTLVGIHLPGKHALLHGLDVQFMAPVYIGDLLTIEGKVHYLNESYQQAWIAAVISNQAGKQISKAKIKVGVS
jgi:3-hydroxybutyryl-CoA dehydratase